MVTVLLTHSRGGFLALVGTLVLIAWRSGHLFRMIGMLGILTLLFLALAPQHVLDRIASISATHGDSSVQARFDSWRIALRMIADNPIFGVGLRNFQEHFFTYGAGLFDPDAPFAHVAHDSYLQIWAEGGSIAFVIYMALLASVYVSCRRLRHAAKLRSDLYWIMDYARMMEATTFGFMIGAVFLNRGHFDLIYHWLGIMACLVLIAHAELMRVPQTEGKRKGLELNWRSAHFGPRMLHT